MTRGLVAIAAVVAIAIVLEVGLGAVVHDASLRQLMMLTLCNVVIAVSLNVINGMAGQFSIGQAGFVGVGAYASAIVAAHLHHALGGGDVTFARSLIVVPIALLTSAVVAAMFGLVIGLPSLRLRGDYLAIVTLGFAEMFRLVIATASVDASGTFAAAIASLGGQTGYSGIDPSGVPAYAGPFWIVIIAALVVALAWRLKFSAWGRALRALREDEIAAASVGIDPVRYKVQSFVIAAIGGGLAGGLLAMMRDGTPVVYPESFGFQASFDAIMMVILGGSGSVTGAALGAAFVTLSIRAIELLQGTRAVRDFGERFASLDLNALRMILYAAILIALMIRRPTGLLGERELFARKARA